MKSILFAAGLLLIAPLAVAPVALAQGAPQTLTKLNLTTVATGFRASKLIGAAVVNDANEKIGSVDDLIVTRSDRVPYAILSVGGFLGVGDKRVAIPMENLEFGTDRTVFKGASKEFLKTLPAFTYAK
jgi:hypothetical protein